jgi:8-oxo-dGTP diphosphatase
MNQEYVAGFVFSDWDKSVFSGRSVVLIRKNKPEWQKDKLNGVGGKIELDETPPQAMAREFREETGVKTNPMDWILFCSVKFLSNSDTVHFFKLFSTDICQSIKTQDPKEPVYHLVIEETHSQSLPNLKWLIPLALSGDILHCTQL